MKWTLGFWLLAIFSLAVFILSAYGIVQAQNMPTKPYLVYLMIVGIVAGLGGAVSFIGRAIRAASRHE